ENREEFRKPETIDLLFPISHREMFNAVLDELDLKTDREGLPRTAYSLRHTYICMRLTNGADPYQVANNCRTSVDMINKYYGTHVKNRIDTTLVNVRKRKSRKKARTADNQSDAA